MGKKVRSTLSRLSGQFWSSSQVEDKRAGKVLLDKVADAEVEVGEFEGPVATVSVTGGMTTNMGNFQSARVDVGVTMPCYPEEVGDVFAALKSEEVRAWMTPASTATGSPRTRGSRRRRAPPSAAPA